MPIKKSAIKAMRQSRKRFLKNTKIKNRLKDLIKKSKQVIAIKEQSAAAARVKEAIKAIDKAIQNKVLKKNTGARKKSRLMKKLNLLAK